MENLFRRLRKITQGLNMTNRKISFYEAKKTSASQAQRKAETRGKIQLGGLLIKSGLADLFSISAGSDLQLDEEEKEKATLLLGALIEMRQTITSITPSQKEDWARLGRSAFMEHFLMRKGR